jgi:hypothetical protein
LKGVKEVRNGFRKSREINTVTYDANIITIKEMVSTLEAAGTYLGLAEE